MSTNSTNHGELSLIELVLSFIKLLKMALRQWKLMFVFCVLFGGIGLLVGYLNTPYYKAALTFMVDEGDKNGGAMSSYLSLASQFGLGGGGMLDKGSKMSDENVAEFLKTRTVMEMSLLESVDARKKGQSLANFYIEALELREEWGDKPKLKNISFSSDRKNWTLQHDSLITEFHAHIMKKFSTVEKVAKQADLIGLTINTPNDTLSILLAQNMVKSLSQYFAEKRTAKARFSMQSIERRADSIKQVIQSLDYRLAKEKDASRRVIREVGFVNVDRLERESGIIGIMYAEVSKNLEASKVNVTNQTPIIEIVDNPKFPLRRKRMFGPTLGTLGGLFLGALFGLVFIQFRTMSANFVSKLE